MNKISEEEMELIRTSEKWPYNFVREIMRNDDQKIEKLSSDWKNFLIEQIGFLSNRCGYKSVNILKDRYKNGLSIEDLCTKFSLAKSEIESLEDKTLKAIRVYNNIIYRSYDWCEENNKLSAELVNITDFKPAEIKFLNELGIWSAYQYLQSKSLIVENGWTASKYEHFKNKIVDQFNYLKNTDFSIGEEKKYSDREMVKDILKDKVGEVLDRDTFRSIINPIRNMANLSDENKALCPGTTKNLLRAFGYEAIRHGNNIIIRKEGEQMMEEVNSFEGVSVFSGRFLKQIGYNSLDEVKIADLKEVRSELIKNGVMANAASTVINEVMATMPKVMNVTIKDTPEKEEDMSSEKVEDEKKEDEEKNMVIDVTGMGSSIESKNKIFKAYMELHDGIISVDEMKDMTAKIYKLIGKKVPYKFSDANTSMYNFAKASGYRIKRDKSDGCTSARNLEGARYIISIVDNSDVKKPTKKVEKVISPKPVKESCDDLLLDAIPENIREAFKAYMKRPAKVALVESVTFTCPYCGEKYENVKFSKIRYCTKCGEKIELSFSE